VLAQSFDAANSNLAVGKRKKRFVRRVEGTRRKLRALISVSAFFERERL